MALTEKRIDEIIRTIRRHGVLANSPRYPHVVNLGRDFPPIEFSDPIPPTISWRAFVGFIKDQGAEGSCAGFAGVKVMEMQQGIHLVERAEEDLSERFLYFAAKCRDGDPTDPNKQEGTTLAAIADCLLHYGTPTEQSCPYAANQKFDPSVVISLQLLTEARKYRINQYRNLLLSAGQSIHENIQRELTNGPVIMGVQVHRDFMTPDDSGYINPKAANGTPLGGHAIAFIGYDTTDKTLDQDGWYTFANSWGEGYGAGGLGRISFGLLERILISGYGISVN